MNTTIKLPNNSNACKKCNKTIAKNHRTIQCHKCTSIIHIKCNEIDVKTYNKIKSENLPQLCYQCKILPVPNPKFKCPVCNRTIAKNHRFIKCNLCFNKVHIRCNGTDELTYNALEKDHHSTIIIFPFKILQTYNSLQNLLFTRRPCPRPNVTFVLKQLQ